MAIYFMHLACARAETTVQQHHVYEGRLSASNMPPSNPFALSCHVLLSGPPASRHARMNVTMFYDGAQAWGWRFCPDVVGDWNWTTACAPGYGLDGHHGSISSIAASDGRLGPVIADPVAPAMLAYASGEQYTLVGIEVA